MVQRTTIALDNDVYRKVRERVRKGRYKNIQQYIYELIRRDIFRKKAGGRPKTVSSEDAYLDKFSTPTKETRKIERMIREGKM